MEVARAVAAMGEAMVVAVTAEGRVAAAMEVAGRARRWRWRWG